MNSLILAGIASLVIDCKTISIPPNENQWQQDICASLETDFHDVQFTALKVSQHPAPYMKTGLVSAGKLFAGRMTVEYVKEIEKQPIRIRYQFSVKAYKNVMVSKKKMLRKNAINTRDIQLTSMNVAPFIGLRTFLDELPGGKVLNKNISKNQIIFPDYLDDRDLISELQRVNVALDSGGIRLQTTGIAIESAKNEGDIIKVKIIETNAVVNGVVTGKENVLIEM